MTGSDDAPSLAGRGFSLTFGDSYVILNSEYRGSEMEFETALFTHLGIRKGITAIIGGGGKTTLLMRLGTWYRAFGSVVLTTSTHIFPPENTPLQEVILERIPLGFCIALGTRNENGKLSPPLQPFSEIIALSDYVFVEADGSKGLPAKAHAVHEPVIPDQTGCVIAVLGLDAIGCPVEQSVHRSEILCRKMGLTPDHLFTPQIAANLLLSYPNISSVLLNKADSYTDVEKGREIAVNLPFPVAITSLTADSPILELWRNGTCLLS